MAENDLVLICLKKVFKTHDLNENSTNSTNRHFGYKLKPSHLPKWYALSRLRYLSSKMVFRLASSVSFSSLV